MSHKKSTTVTKKRAAELLGITEAEVVRRCESGELKGTKITSSKYSDWAIELANTATIVQANPYAIKKEVLEQLTTKQTDKQPEKQPEKTVQPIPIVSERVESSPAEPEAQPEENEEGEQENDNGRPEGEETPGTEERKQKSDLKWWF